MKPERIFEIASLVITLVFAGIAICSLIGALLYHAVYHWVLFAMMLVMAIVCGIDGSTSRSPFEMIHAWLIRLWDYICARAENIYLKCALFLAKLHIKNLELRIKITRLWK